MFLGKQFKLLFVVLGKLRKNPIILVPDVLMTFLTLIIVLFSLYVSGLWNVILSNPFAIPVGNGFSSLTNFVTDYFKSFDNWTRLIIGIIVFSFTHFFVGSGIIATKFVMMKKLIEDKKVNILKCFIESGNFYWKVIYLRILFYILSSAFISLIGLIIAILLGNFMFSTESILRVVIIASMIISWIVTLVLFYRYPILFLDEKKALETIKYSFVFFKKNFSFILTSALIIVFLSICLNVILLIVNKMLPSFAIWFKQYFDLISMNGFTAVILATIIYFARSIFGILFGVLGDLFLFNCYKIKR